MRKVAICDDEQLQLDAAAETLVRFGQDTGMEIQVARYRDIDAMLASFSSEQPDIAFLDIEFDGEPLGIQAARRVNEAAPDCQVVYLTNYLQYTLDVYQTSHAWYVLKSQFARRLPDIFAKLDALDDARKQRIVVHARDGRIVSVPCTGIRYLERRDRFTRIVLEEGAVEVREKLPAVLERLPQGDFARCHNSYAVNMPLVAEVRAGELTLDDGTRILVSRGWSKRFREAYLHWATRWTV